MSSAFAMNVQVFTDSVHPVDTSGLTHKTQVKYYNLDQLKTLVRKMNSSIRGESKDQAELQSKQMMQKYRPQLKHASKGIQLIHKYNIKKIPATVFDNGKYTVFGQTNLQTSVQDYKQWLKQQK